MRKEYDMKSILKATLVIIFSGIFVSSAMAVEKGTAPAALGVRGGLGSNPDQVVAGVQSIFGQTLSAARFGASVDLGFGDNLTTIALNGDLQVPFFTFPNSTVSLYGAAGPTIILYDPKFGDSKTKLGLTLTLGAMFGPGKHYNLESRFGLGDAPDFRILVGVLFGSTR